MVRPAPSHQHHMKSSIITQNWDEEVTDNVTGHKIVTIGNEVFELKLCQECGKWLPVEMFRNSKLYLDGRLPHCKGCAYPRRPRKEVYPVRVLTPEEDSHAKIVNTVEDAIKTLLSEIDTLKEQNKLLSFQKKDLNHLTESEIQQVLRNNDIPPRLLFNAISLKHSHYQFFCKDTVSGLTSVIKTEAF